ncbi:hypothetical protein BOX15_Mlig007542g2 [Macrostomum lignano]|uniref:MIF4G domain-containing protein n=1 Tax=Macrostomum lignano TaxID=282301 RepID=A0A267DLR8_9PLAT|nr:hypothetical protein BOX15_Mlig007542g2 [Macrostomum lignano]
MAHPHRYSHGRHDRSQHNDDEEGGSRSKRSRLEYEELIAKERLEDLIAQLGNHSTIEQHETVQNNVHDLSMVLESEIPKFKDAIIEVLVACASERPDKLRVYGTLVGLINLKNHAFVGEFLERLVKELRTELQSGTSWSNLLCTVRFLAELVNYRVVAPASLLQLFNSFLGVTLEEGIPQARSDFFVHLVLASLPWAAAPLAEKHRTELMQLLSSVDSYRARRSLNHVTAVQSLAGQEDWIDSLWHQIQSLAKADWREKCSLRFEAFASMLASPDAVCHSLPAAIAPQPHEEASAAIGSSTSSYPPPRTVFRLFDYTDVPEDGPALPGEHSIERYLVEEHLSALIACHYHDRKECAKALLSARFGVRVPLPYMITELVMGQMLRLPQSDLLHLFYCSLLIELCKEDPETMPNVVAQATFSLFDRINGLNAECLSRLAKWFSYHLSQCKYQWSWSDWTDECQDLVFSHPKLVFLRDTAQLLVRFSYYDHVRKSFGTRLAPMLLHDKPPECHYKYDIEEDFSPEVVQSAQRLIDAIRERCTPERAIEVLNTLPVPAGGAENGGPNERHLLLKVDVFFSTLLFLGSKSFSHSFAALAKFHSVCKALVPLDNQAAKLRVLASLYECWRWHEQMLIVLLDKLVKVQLVDCQAVFDWLFGDCLGDSGEGLLPKQELSRCYSWDAAESTLSKMCKQLARLNEDWAKARQRYDSYHEKMRSGTAGDEDAAAAQKLPTDQSGPAAMLVDEDTPTRDELDAKLDRLEKARQELRLLVACLLRCAVWGAEGGGIPSDEACSGSGDEEANERHLRRLVYERSLACLTMHYSDVKPAMRDLRAQPPVAAHSVAAAQKFCNAFFSLSD